MIMFQNNLNKTEEIYHDQDEIEIVAFIYNDCIFLFSFNHLYKMYCVY